jgi:6,7-dimethyl-8-ribityllumazine synthase
LFAFGSPVTTAARNRAPDIMAKKRAAAPARAKKSEPPLRFLVVEARFYREYSDLLLEGAVKALADAGAEHDVITVPGALEIPAAIVMGLEAAKAKRKPYDGVVALGCVIQGETYHFDLVANESARALMQLSVDLQLPLGNGILTVDDDHQAKARLGGNHGHKGIQAAHAALTMARLKRELKGK